MKGSPASRLLRVLALWLCLSLLGWAGILWALRSLPIGPLPEPPLWNDALAAPEDDGSAAPLAAFSIPDRLGRGDTLSSVLSRNGIDGAQVHEMARALSAVMEVRHLRDGDEIELLYGPGGSLESVMVHRGPLEKLALVRSESGWYSEKTEVEIERRTLALAGTLRDNLFLSMARLGESPPLAIAFAKVFSWDFDFHSQSREGDRFAFIVEKLYREGRFVGYGDLQAARYVSYLGGERAFSAFLYEDPSGRRDYYDPDGKSLRKAFLRAPLDFERISSGFSYSRLHPVHRRRMPHLGVDYAARKGTPVYSVAAGVVVDRGFRGGGGNTVAVRHAMGYTSKYLHLSRFAKGLSVGKRVQQKEVIGYVGDTGTVTAAHLDFRLLRHGVPVNPLTQIFPPGPPVPEEFREEFALLKASFEKSLDALAGRLPVEVDD